MGLGVRAEDKVRASIVECFSTMDRDRDTAAERQRLCLKSLSCSLIHCSAHNSQSVVYSVKCTKVRLQIIIIIIIINLYHQWEWSTYHGRNTLFPNDKSSAACHFIVSLCTEELMCSSELIESWELSLRFGWSCLSVWGVEKWLWEWRGWKWRGKKNRM